MHILEIVLLLWLVCLPVYTALTFDKHKQQLINGSLTRCRAYKETIFFLWIPTAILLISLWLTGRSLASIGLSFSVTVAELVGLGVLLILAILAGVNLSTLRNKAESRAKLAKDYEPMRYILPQTKQELAWFNLGVSPTAGFCEELIFRGYLIWLLTPQVGLVGAIVLSSVLFGLNHIYQGWAGVLKTGVMGLIFALVFWATGSLVAAIILHILVDVFAGFQSYLVLRDNGPGQQGHDHQGDDHPGDDYQGQAMNQAGLDVS